MAGFLDRAKEQAQRQGNDLLRRLGSAYYAEQRGSGSSAGVQQALSALEQHIAQHGDGFLRGS